MEEKTEAIIGWIIIIVVLLIWDYYQFVKYCANWFYFFKPWC